MASDTTIWDATLIKVLLVEDDEDDFIITRDLFGEMRSQRFTLDWMKTFDTGLQAMTLNQHDVCLVDYRLGARNGVDLLRAALERGCQAPVILLTGAGEHEIDLEAMRAGAADYLVKTELQAKSLERSIRYALQRKRAAALAAFEQARLAAFGADIGLALTRPDRLDAIMDRCARAMSQYLNAAVAQITTLKEGSRNLQSLAIAGPLADNPELRSALQAFEPDFETLHQGKPVVVKQIAADTTHPLEEIIKREGIASWAACPLLLEDKLVGLMSIFCEHPLQDQIALEMGSVGHGIALCIERNRSKEALGASESKYRTVVESIQEVIFQLDEFGNWTFLNPAWTAVTGFDVATTLNTFFLEYIYQDDRAHNQEIFLNFVERKLEYCRYETRFLTKNGKIRWVEVYSQIMLGSEGRISGISGSLTDITERKVAEIQIQKLAAFPRVNPNPVLEFSADGSLSYANDAALQMAKALGREEVLSILPTNQKDLVVDCLRQGQNRLREEVQINGHTLTWSFFPVPSSQVVHCYGVDVTDVLNLEAQLRHAQKLESVGQLAAGIAHDFNNILTIIQGYADCLLARAAQDKAASSALKQIGNAARRAASLTRQLLTFSRKQIIQTKVLDLNGVLQNLYNMLPRLLGEDIILETVYAKNLARIEADTGMIEQVVMNLAVNSRDAMPKGGKLTISTSLVQVQQEHAVRNPDARAGNFCCLTVSDTGCGMDFKTLDRIFEPFFTTKEVGKGTGLGLATVYGIVKQHEGWIEVASEVGAGTTFKIYFPAVLQAEAPPVETAGDAVTINGGKETILLVEDESMLRELAREILESYHYRVVEAHSGVDALRKWDEHNGKIDLLLSDMVMPEGLNGKELAEQLQRRKPTLPVILSSGYSAESLGKELGEGSLAFLPKPFLPQQLAQLVRQCLDRAHEGRTPANRDLIAV
jgi:PAS domain S-box-containing protein